MLRVKRRHREKLVGGIVGVFLSGIIIIAIILFLNVQQSNVVSEDTTSTPMNVESKQERRRSVKEATDQNSENRKSDSSQSDAQERESKINHSEQVAKPRSESHIEEVSSKVHLKSVVNLKKWMLRELTLIQRQHGRLSQ